MTQLYLFFFGFISRYIARMGASKIFLSVAFFEFLIPLVTNTVGKLFLSIGGGFAVFQLGDVVFDYVFNQLHLLTTGSIPMEALQMVKLMGLDTAINIYMSFLFALLTVKGMDRMGNIKRQVWNTPKDSLPGKGTMEF